MSLKKGMNRPVLAILGIAQLLLGVVAIGLEVGSIFVDFAHGTLWAGFWVGFVFLWTGFLLLLMACCCCRSMYGSIYGLIWMTIAVATAITFLALESYFLNNLCACYLSNTLCCAIGSVSDIGSSNYNSNYNACSSSSTSITTCRSTPTGKLSYIKAQLATSIGMIITCAVYLVVFILQCVGICGKDD